MSRLGQRVDDATPPRSALSAAQNETTVSTVLSAKIDHAIAALHAARDQMLGERVGARLELGIGDALLAAHQRHLVRRAGGRSG